VAFAVNLALLGGAGAWWWHSRGAFIAAPSTPAEEVATKGPEQPAGTPPAQPTSTAPPLAPLQLSPQRLQSIGVTTGSVQRKAIHDDIRVVGNVAVDEQKQAYVQTRFSGWIQQVFANANYQYVKKASRSSPSTARIW